MVPLAHTLNSATGDRVAVFVDTDHPGYLAVHLPNLKLVSSSEALTRLLASVKYMRSSRVERICKGFSVQCAVKEKNSKKAVIWFSTSSPLLLHSTFALARTTVSSTEISSSRMLCQPMHYCCMRGLSVPSQLSTCHTCPPDLDPLHFENTNGSTKAMNVIGPRLTLMGKATERPCSPTTCSELPGCTTLGPPKLRRSCTAAFGDIHAILVCLECCGPRLVDMSHYLRADSSCTTM